MLLGCRYSGHAFRLQVQRACFRPPATPLVLPLLSLLLQLQFTSPSTKARLWLNTQPGPAPATPTPLFDDEQDHFEMECLNKSIAHDQTGYRAIQRVHLGPLNRTFEAPYFPASPLRLD